MQLFDSWAHHLSPAQFREFSLPYAQRILSAVKAVHPDTPLIFHANGGEQRAAWAEARGVLSVLSWQGWVSLQPVLMRLRGFPSISADPGHACSGQGWGTRPGRGAGWGAGTGKLESLGGCTADVVGLDWAVDLPEARRALPGRVTQGNMDPMLLFGGEGALRQARFSAHGCSLPRHHSSWSRLESCKSLPAASCFLEIAPVDREQPPVRCRPCRTRCCIRAGNATFSTSATAWCRCPSGPAERDSHRTTDPLSCRFESRCWFWHGAVRSTCPIRDLTPTEGLDTTFCIICTKRCRL